MLTRQQWSDLNIANEIDAQFGRELWRARIDRMVGLLTGHSSRLPQLDQQHTEVAHKIQPVAKSVAIDAIRGSATPRVEFDHTFRPRRSTIEQRWQSLALAWIHGQAIDPIEVIQVGANYYVVDGHLRVSVARALGQAYIDAHVRQVPIEWTLDHVPAQGDLAVLHTVEQC